MTAIAERRNLAPVGSARLLAGVGDTSTPVSLDAHLRRFGPLDADIDLCQLLSRSGLRGRGGASFPTAAKLVAVRDGHRRPVVVANGAEGEPPSGKDKALLAYAPHLVLDGAVAAARAVGAREAIVTTTRSVVPQVEHALAERRHARIDRRISLQLVVVPDRFVAGEETALVQFLNGGPALPTFTPPRPYERGVGGAPTLVQNVETLAHLALVARFGATWFRSAGTADEPGTALFTVSGAVRSPGVYEIPLGLPLDALVADAGGATGVARAYLVGGYFGTWIDSSASGTPLTDAALSTHGATLGARAIVVLPNSACGIAQTARIAAYLAEQSAGQCGPCVHGLASVADDLATLAKPGRRVDVAQLRRRLGVIAGRGACRHPDGAIRLVASALRVFAGDVDRHLHGLDCEAHT